MTSILLSSMWRWSHSRLLVGFHLDCYNNSLIASRFFTHPHPPYRDWAGLLHTPEHVMVLLKVITGVPFPSEIESKLLGKVYKVINPPLSALGALVVAVRSRPCPHWP